MNERRHSILVCAAAAVLLAGVVLLSLLTENRVAPPALQERVTASRTNAAERATSPAIAPPIEREEAPRATPPSMISTTKGADVVVTQIYAVRDLLFGKDAVASAEDLGVTLKEATDPAYWQGNGRSLVVEESGVIEVTASADMHRKVLGVLRDMRRFAKR